MDTAIAIKDDERIVIVVSHKVNILAEIGRGLGSRLAL